MIRTKFFIEKKAIAVCVFLLCFVMGSVTYALEYPQPCFTDEELARVREWEKTWVGKKIDASNMDSVKEFIPESYYNMMKEPEKWGGGWFTIAPYRKISPTPGDIKFTKQYYGQSKVGASGELLNYVSGIPFPGTKVGIELAHNFRNRLTGDASETVDFGKVVDGRLKYDMDIKLTKKQYRFSGRADFDPVPEVPNNTKKVWSAFTMLQLDPPEVRNMRIMEIKYQDRMKSYDSWFWLPSIRRIRRRSTTERQDAQGGGDYSAFDNLGWDGAIQMNKYKYVGDLDTLMGRHASLDKIVHEPGECIYNGLERERVKVHIVDVSNDDPNFMYSKMTWYLDPETWFIVFSERYDRRGRLWKVLDQHQYVDTSHETVKIPEFNITQMVDVQRIHSTPAASIKKFGMNHDVNIFTRYYLQKYGY